MKKSLSITIISVIALISFGATLSLVLNVTNNNQRRFTLPPLPYAYNALEPYIDAQTMELHYSKHHQSYVDNLNETLKNYPDLLTKPIEQLLIHIEDLPQEVQEGVQNFGGGHYNHSLFWLMMTPKSTKKPIGAVKDLIDKHFGNFEKFKEQFNNVAKKVFGSGWAWLCIDEEGNLLIVETKDQDSPLDQGLIPLLGLDVWEHAYYLKYQNKRVDYIGAWWNVVNWEQVEKNYQAATNLNNKRS